MTSAALSQLCPAQHDAPPPPTATGFPARRPRRLRSNAAVRRLVTETRLHPAELVLPLFIREGLDEAREIPSLPGVLQHSRDSLKRAAVEAVEAGVGGLMLFGVPSERDAQGSAGSDPKGVLNSALRDLHAEVGDATVLMSDVCLDEFTDHGHCGVLNTHGRVDNDATLVRYAELALAQADAGAQMLGLSGMMDGQVSVVRSALETAGYHETAILSYAAKFASSYYGPFRDAVESPLQGDRRTYQVDPPNALDAVQEALLDVAEGADIVMVKPALPYLDILREISQRVEVPVAAYHVSGEKALIEAASERGWVERESMLTEALTSIKRAGARFTLSYNAVEVAHAL